MKTLLIILVTIVSLYIIYIKTNNTKIKDKKSTTTIQVEHLSDEISHGDHWGAIYGYESDIENKIDFDSLKLEKELKPNLLVYSTKNEWISNVGLVKDNELITLFPVLSKTKSIPFEIKKIVEWDITDGWEAHIIGVGKDTFSIGFFATDYARNKKRYQKGDFSEVELSAFAYVVEKSNLGKESSSNSEVNISFAPEFCGFFPSSQLDTEFDYDFVGNVLYLQYFEYQGEKFALFDIQLIQNEDLNFVIPMAVNIKNMRDSDIKVGDKIAGAFWLQGKIKER